MILADVVFGGAGFVAADLLDRFLATYDPSSKTPPDDKFTGDGEKSTVANALNVANIPSWLRMGVGLTSCVVLWIVFLVTSNTAAYGMLVGTWIRLFSMVCTHAVTCRFLSPDLRRRLFPSETTAREAQRLKYKGES